MNVLSKIAGALIPSQTYTVGGKSSASSKLPVELTLKIDPDFKKTLLIGTALMGIGVGVGVGIGIVNASTKRK